MKEPGFWQKGGNRLIRWALWPASLGWRAFGTVRRATIRPARSTVPVICIGNLEMGGTGKTPTVELVKGWFTGHGVRGGVLSRGYGGHLSGGMPVLVDPGQHTAADVGDEPLLHARSGPVVISPDRAAGAELLSQHCDVIIMDDGHQNPGLSKDLSLIVTRAAEAFGNGSVFPSGPLREPVAAGLARANAIVAIGGGVLDHRIKGSGLPVLRGRMRASADLEGRRLFAFCGIGRPERFRDTLQELGAELAGFQSFSDHHAFTDRELDSLAARAEALDATLITTEKDAVRLPDDFRAKVSTVPITLVLDQPEMMDGLLRPILDQVTKPSSGEEPTNRS